MKKKDKSHKQIKVIVHNPLTKEEQDRKIDEINKLIKVLYE